MVTATRVVAPSGTGLAGQTGVPVGVHSAVAEPRSPDPSGDAITNDHTGRRPRPASTSGADDADCTYGARGRVRSAVPGDAASASAQPAATAPAATAASSATRPERSRPTRPQACSSRNGRATASSTSARSKGRMCAVSSTTW